jgi:nitrite reductase (NO-forming)
LAAACGGGGEPDGSDVPAEIAVDADLTLIMEDIDELIVGYAVEGEEVTSPGPTLRLQAGKEVTITVENRSSFAHDFRLVAEKTSDAEPLWDAATAYLRVGKRGSLAFTPDRAGEFFYICALRGHLTLHGMWGQVVVEE